MTHISTFINFLKCYRHIHPFHSIFPNILYVLSSTSTLDIYQAMDKTFMRSSEENYLSLAPLNEWNVYSFALTFRALTTSSICCHHHHCSFYLHARSIHFVVPDIVYVPNGRFEANKTCLSRPLHVSLSLSSFCRYQKSQKNKHFSCVTLQWCSLYCSALNGCWKCSIMLHFLSTQLIMKNFHSLIYHSQARLYIEWDKINFCNYTSNMFKHSFFVFRIATHCQYSTYILYREES